MATKKTTTSKSAAPPRSVKSASKEKSVSELVSTLAEKTGLTKAKVREIIDAHTELLASELQSAGSVQLAGIGKLKLGDRAERQGRNPATGEAITIPASKTVKFSGGKAFKSRFQ